MILSSNWYLEMNLHTNDYKPGYYYDHIYDDINNQVSMCSNYTPYPAIDKLQSIKTGTLMFMKA